MQPVEWSSQVQGLHSVKTMTRYIGSVFCALLFLYTNNAYAADIGTVLANLRGVILPLTSLVLVISFVMGIGMIFGALTKMKKFGSIMTMQSGEKGEIGGPLVSFVVGAVLIYLPTSTDFLMNSLFETSQSIFGGGGNINYQAMGQGATLLSYSSASAGLSMMWADMANTLVLFIQFLGFVSFLKGWIIMSKAASPGHQPGTFSKGLTHIVGGIVLINFIGMVNIIKNTIYGS